MSAAILGRWRATCAESASRAAIWSPAGEVWHTFAQVQERAGVWCEILHDLPAGSVLGIQLGNHPDWPAAFLAAAQLGLVTLPLDQSLHPAAQARVLAETGARAVLEPQLRMLDPHFAFDWGDTALLKMTSGSTGEPRLVRLTGEQLLADADQIVASMGLRQDDLNYGAIPFSHSYGFSNLITPLLAHGVPLVAAQDVFPRAILAGLERTQATIFPGVPLIFRSLLELGGAALPASVRLCISAGAPLLDVLRRDFHQRCGRKIHSFYGASECGGICFDASADIELPSGFVGTPLAEVTLAAAAAGRVEVRSAAVGQGYFPAEPDADLRPGSFQPGDVLEQSAAGWRIAGRVSDFINIASRKVNPVEIENVLLQHPGVREAVVFGVDSPSRGQSAVAAVIGLEELRAEGLLRHCRQHLAPWQVPATVWFPRKLPVSERGKISREALRQQFEATREPDVFR